TPPRGCEAAGCCSIGFSESQRADFVLTIGREVASIGLGEGGTVEGYLLPPQTESNRAKSAAPASSEGLERRVRVKRRSQSPLLWALNARFLMDQSSCRCRPEG